MQNEKMSDVLKNEIENFKPTTLKKTNQIFEPTTGLTFTNNNNNQFVVEQTIPRKTVEIDTSQITPIVLPKHTGFQQAKKVLWWGATQALNSPRITGAISLILGCYAAYECMDYIGFGNIAMSTGAVGLGVYAGYKHVPAFARLVDRKIDELTAQLPKAKMH